MSHQAQVNNDVKNQDEQNLKVENHILDQYELLDIKGKGAYGIVWKARDKKSNQIVALKKVFDAFQNSTDAQRTFREVMFLQQLRNHDNIIKLDKVIRAQNDKDLYMIFEYMDTDLHKVIRANILEPVHKQYIIYQLLKALKYKNLYFYLNLRYLHSGGLIHRDLKPANLLVDGECVLKLADFGLARTLNQKQELESNMMTEYVATRWYRAPEILLGSQTYSKAVDMWSVGCVLGETLINKAVFPGNSTINQVELIIELLGVPNQEDIEAIQAPLAAQVLESIQINRKKSFKQVFSTATLEQLDFLRNLLLFNPSKRLTVDQALNHPYLKEFHGSEEELVLSSPIKIIMDDNVQYSKSDYRKVLYNQLTSQIKFSQPSSISPKKNQYSTSNEQQSPNNLCKPIQQPSKSKIELCRKKQTRNLAKPNYLKPEISEPSTTTSDKIKDARKKQFFEDKVTKFQKYHSPQNQDSKKGFYSYQFLSETIQNQKDGLQINNMKKNIPIQFQQQTQAKEERKSDSVKLFKNTNINNILMKSSSDQILKLQKLVQMQTSPPQQIFSNGTLGKLRTSIAQQQRVFHQHLGSIYQLGSKVQLFPQTDYTQLNQNKSSIDKPKNTINLSSSIHLKSNSYIQRKKNHDGLQNNFKK